MTNQTLTYLEQIRDNLEFVSYGTIYQKIAELRNKFIPTALLNKGWYIDRVRINKPGEIFTNSQQLSYVHDKDILDKYVDFGRANEPKQAVFYGSIYSHQIDQPLIVAYFETSEILKEIDKFDSIEEVFTLSRWTILEDIQVVEMIFSDQALEVNEYTQLSFKDQMTNYMHLPYASHYKEQGRFFSNEYARSDIKKQESFKYKITSAYSNYIWRNSHLKGITFPSVASRCLGQNVALLPELVDKYLKLEAVGMFKFEKKNGVHLPISCLKLATDLGKNCMNFNWYDYVDNE